MGNPEHLAKFEEGVEAWRAWRKANPGVKPDLDGADLYAAVLMGADLDEVSLRGANLRRADLRGANLQEADLRGANLQEADLTEADLWGANLRRANLRGANLRRADLRGTYLLLASKDGLEGADFDGATFDYAGLVTVRLEGATFGDAFERLAAVRLELTLADSVSPKAVYDIMRALDIIHTELAGKPLTDPIIRIGRRSEVPAATVVWSDT